VRCGWNWHGYQLRVIRPYSVFQLRSFVWKRNLSVFSYRVVSCRVSTVFFVNDLCVRSVDYMKTSRRAKMLNYCRVLYNTVTVFTGVALFVFVDSFNIVLVHH
jgi:hypothetical protein